MKNNEVFSRGFYPQFVYMFSLLFYLLVYSINLDLGWPVYANSYNALNNCIMFSTIILRISIDDTLVDVNARVLFFGY